MIRFILSILLLVLSFMHLNANELVVETMPRDPLGIFILDMFQKQQDTTMCSAPTDSIETIRTNLISYLQFNGFSSRPTAQEAAAVLWKLYPCPFTPYRPELQPATKNDIEGVWIFPKNSQKIRFGSRLAKKNPLGPLPITCDGMGYYPNGELRQVIISGQTKCPFKKTTDMDIARKNPPVSNWSLLQDGRIGVTRTDISNHIEEWDIYKVIIPFSFDNIQFTSGDLVAYLRKENGNDVGASTQFRHLKRIP